MTSHRVTFVPSGRSQMVAEGETILDAALRCSEPLTAECGGGGACGRCLVQIVEGEVPDYRILRRNDGQAEVLACLTPVKGPLTVLRLVDAELPHLVSRDRYVGIQPLVDWAPWPLRLDPIDAGRSVEDLGVAIDVGTTTVRLLLIRLSDGTVIGEAGAYNPQIAKGADVISRIVAAEKGLLGELQSLIGDAVAEMLGAAVETAGVDASQIRGYMVAGNVTMIHLLLGEDPSGIRRVPSEPRALAFGPVAAPTLGWPGAGPAPVHTVPAAGGWVGGDIVVGAVRAGLSREADRLTLYVDLGTNGEIAFGGADFALACACSAGPAFEGGGIRCGMRADPGAIDGVRLSPDSGTFEPSVIGGGRAKGVCGSGLIGLAHALLSVGWIDRGGRITDSLPARYRLEGPWGVAVALDESRQLGLWERDLASLVRAKAAIFAGIRSLTTVLGQNAARVDRVIVSGNFGRYLNLPAAIGIGLLPELPFGHYSYVDNGSLEGAALALLSREFLSEVTSYLGRITYVDLSELPGYLDEFVGASFLPHTDPALLRL
jgi:uncharacterized 2Fe-2S/4Fe-4S cluster protein (DUF4445 family)